MILSADSREKHAGGLFIGLILRKLLRQLFFLDTGSDDLSDYKKDVDKDRVAVKAKAEAAEEHDEMAGIQRVPDKTEDTAGHQHPGLGHD